MEMMGLEVENKPKLRRNKGPGLTILTDSPTTCPIDIPSNQCVRQRFSVESMSVSLENSYEAESPSRSIATQTPTEHMSFEYPIPCVVVQTLQTQMSGGNLGIGELNGHTHKRKKPGLYGQHSFREEREQSWFPVPDWFRLGASSRTSPSPAAAAPFSRNSRLRRSVVITNPPRPRSMSFSSVASSVEELEGIGQQLRSIGDDFDRLGFRP